MVLIIIHALKRIYERRNEKYRKESYDYKRDIWTASACFIRFISLHCDNFWVTCISNFLAYVLSAVLTYIINMGSESISMSKETFSVSLLSNIICFMWTSQTRACFKHKIFTENKLTDSQKTPASVAISIYWVNE